MRTRAHEAHSIGDATNPTAKAEACDELEPFAALLKAKTGKGITRAQAERWRADADRVGALAGC